MANRLYPEHVVLQEKMKHVFPYGLRTSRMPNKCGNTPFQKTKTKYAATTGPTRLLRKQKFQHTHSYGVTNQHTHTHLQPNTIQET